MPADYQTTPRKNRKSALLFPFLMVISMITWGGSWVSAKILAQQLTPEMLSFWRFFLSFISFIPFMFILPRPIIITFKGSVYSALGAVFMSLYMYFFFLGLEHWFAGHAGVLVTSMIPLMTLIISLLFFRERINARKLVGLAMGMTGASILLRLWTLDLHGFFTGNNVLFIVCPVIWALLTICSQRAAGSVSSYVFSFITFGLSTLFYLPWAAGQGIFTVFERDAIFWINLIFLSVISGTLATTVYFVSAERLGSYMTSSYVFLVPTSAMLLSWFFLGEVPETTTLVGGTVTIAAVYIITRGT